MSLLDNASAQKEFTDTMEQMTKSMASVREVVRSLLAKQGSQSDLDTKEGISLLSLKHHLMLSYLHSLVLLSSHRVLGHSLLNRTPPPLPFSSPDRGRRGAEAGDLVDSLVEDRIVLEKTKVLEGKMKYQIDKLVRLAEDVPRTDETVIEDPLAFRPNPQNLIGQGDSQSDADEGKTDGIYHPPKLAPMPYMDGKEKSKRRAYVPATLSSLAHEDPSLPHTESTTGLGSMPSFTSSRAREIQRMTEFEEENMTRLVLNKKEAKRRKRDEEDIALGGTGAPRGRARGGGLEAEFGDILRAVERNARFGASGDGYEELRNRSKKRSVLERSRSRTIIDAVPEVGAGSKGSRFEREVKSARKRVRRK